jgi:hypothetical protein
MGEDDPVQRCTMDEPANLRTSLERAGIEFLDIDEQRTVVIFQQAIFILTATKGEITATREFEARLWKEPIDEPNRDPEQLLNALVNALLATADSVPR